MRNHAGGRMRPGHDRPSACRRRARRDDDHPGHGNRLTPHADRTIEHAIGLRACGGKHHRFGTDHRTGRPGKLLCGSVIERRLRMGAGWKHNCCRAEKRSKNCAQSAHSEFHLIKHVASSTLELGINRGVSRPQCVAGIAPCEAFRTTTPWPAPRGRSECSAARSRPAAARRTRRARPSKPRCSAGRSKS